MSISMKDNYVNQAIIISRGDANNSHSRGSWASGANKNDSIPGLNPMTITIHNSVTISKHPVETGEVVMDNKVHKPVEVVVNCLVDCGFFDSVMRTLEKLLNDKSGNTFMIRTKTRDIEGLLLYDIIETQNSDKYDVVEITLKFIEQMEAEVQGYKGTPMQKQNSPKVESGSSYSFINMRFLVDNARRLARFLMF